MANACPKCTYFYVRCKCDEILLEVENKRFKGILEHIAENGCAKCGTVAKQALLDIDPDYEQARADLQPKSPK